MAADSPAYAETNSMGFFKIMSLVSQVDCPTEKTTATPDGKSTPDCLPFL